MLKVKNIEVFKEERLNKQLAENGYVKIKFLLCDEISELSSFYQEIHKEKPEIFISLISSDIDYKKEIDKKIKEVFKRAVNETFSSYTPFWGNFFTKISQSPEMPLHSDLQYVNEPDFFSLNIWCPLADTDISNGTLGIVPYSHFIMKQLRGTNITDAYRKNAKEIADAHSNFLNFEAGEAIIYDHRLLHQSSSNNTNQSRVAATLVMVPKNVQVVHYYAETEGDTTIFKFLINNSHELLMSDFLQKPKELLPIEIFYNYKFNPLTLDDFKFLNNAK